MKFIRYGKLIMSSISVLAVLSAITALVLFSEDVNLQPKSLTAGGSDVVVNSDGPCPVKAAGVGNNFCSGGPILVVTSKSNPFTLYYTEILRAEGFNEFETSDISSISSELLASHEIVILGEMPLTGHQVAILSEWVKGGGRLIAMRPDKKLAGLLGLSDLSSTTRDGYLKVDTSSGPGAGIVKKTIQYHGTADFYDLNGASIIAFLCSDAVTKTFSPAVTLNRVGTRGGRAAAFVYDLARSVVYTRQGNPAWSGQERDGLPPVRSNDLFCGGASFDPQPSWLDPKKVAIPQADEQQRLLANLIIRMTFDKKPLPRFWYFPRGLAAVVVMTGDDHGKGGTGGRFDSYIAMSPPGCSVENWECIRSTSYVYPDTPLKSEQASAYNAAGFELALHVNTDCSGWTRSSLEEAFSGQLADWSGHFSGLPPPVTSRTHCIAWSDYATQPLVELAHGIRLDLNYYYWPPPWAGNRPGLFTGSGMPMRFADPRGNIIDVYQAATQMTDESGQAYPFTVDTLLDRAIGPEGYYGAFVANMHTDNAVSRGSDAIVRSAMKRGIPVVSARQMLKWLDGRNDSKFKSISWKHFALSFSVEEARGANGLVAMAPEMQGREVIDVIRNGNPTPYKFAKIKGIRYAVFNAVNGNYKVQYAPGPSTSGFSRFTPRPAHRVASR